MFRCIFCGAAILTALTVLYLFHVRLKQGDLSFYHKIVQESVDLRAHSALEKSPVRQIRKGVRKDIWTIKDGARTHGRIACVQSDMTITQKKEKMEAVEILHEIEAWMDAGGEIRHLTAESGVCYFPSFRMEARHLALDSKQTKCVAKEAQLDRALHELLLEGDVRIASYLQGKESFAMADSATFQLDQKKIVLESAPHTRVLFKQEGLEISAPRVHVQKAIQGYGDVRFFFYPEEETAIDTFFIKHLKS